MLTFATMLLGMFMTTALSDSTLAQTPVAAPPTTSMPKEPAEIIAAAATLYDFTSPSLKPWHMKVSYQLYDTESKPSEAGTFEYWWGAPDRTRATWKRNGMEVTDWQDGEKHVIASTGPARTFEESRIPSDLLTPLASAEKIDTKAVQLERHDGDFGGVKVPCVVIKPRLVEFSGQSENAPIGLFPTYCFEKDKPMLRAYLTYGGASLIYDKVARTQGRYLPTEMSVQEGKKLLLTAKVDSVTGLAATAPELTPVPTAGPAIEPSVTILASGISQGSLLKKVSPVYPQTSKEHGEEGLVVLDAVIGRDGRVHA